MLFKGAGILSFFKSLIGAITTANIAWGQHIWATRGAAAATLDLKYELQYLWLVMMENPLFLLATLITGVVLAIDFFNKKAEDSIKIIEELNRTLTSQQKIISKTLQYYEENAGKVDRDIKVKQDLIAMEEELQQTFGVTADKIDLVNGKFSDQIDQLKKLKEESLRQAEAKLYKEPDVKEQTFGELKLESKGVLGFGINTAKYTGEATQSVEELIEKLKDARDIILDSENKTVTVGKATLAYQWQKNNALELITESLEKYTKQLETSNMKEEIAKNIARERAFTNDNLNKTQKELRDILEAKIEFQDIQQYQLELEKIQKTITNYDIKNLEEEFRKLDSQISSGEITWQEYNKQANNIKQTLKDIKIDDDTIDSIFLFQEGIDQTTISAEELGTNLENAEAAYKEITDKLKTLDTAFKELNSDEGLASETTAELTRLFPQLVNQLGDTETAIEAITKIYNTLGKEAQEKYRAVLETDEKFYDAIIENNENLTNGLNEQYQQDIKNAQSAAQAKAIIQRAIMKLEARKTYLELQMQSLDPRNALYVKMYLELTDINSQLEGLRNTSKGVETALDETSNALDFTESLKQARDLEGEFDKIKAKAKTLASAIETLSEGNELTFDAISELVDQYPDLLNVLGDNVKLMEKLKELHGQEADKAKEAFKTKLLANETFIGQIAKFNETFFKDLSKAYGTDILNWAQYMKVKRDLSAKAAKVVGEHWNVDLQKSLKTAQDKTKQLYETTTGAVWDVPKTEQYKVGKQVEEFLKTEIKIDDNLNKQIDDIIKGVDFTKIGFTDKQLNKEEKAKNLKKETVDALQQEEAALKAVNNQIEANNELMNQKEGKDRVKLLDNEVKLLGVKKIALNNLLKALKDEKDKTRKALTGLGIKFDATGLMTNIETVEKGIVDKINKAADTGNEKAHESASKALEELKKLGDYYYSLMLDEIPQTNRELTAGVNRVTEINKEKAEIAVKDLDETYKKLAESLEPAQNEIKKLNEELQDTPTENFEKRSELTKKLVSANTGLRDTYGSIITQLGKLRIRFKDHKDTVETIDDLIKQYTSSMDDATETADDFAKSNAEITKQMKETYKTKVEEKIKKVVEAVNKSVEDQIELFERAKDRYDELGNAELKRQYKMADGLQKEIDQLKERNDEIERSQELAKFNKDIDKQQELINNLKKERTLRVYKEGEGWVWKVDEKKIAEEQEKLDDLQQDLADWKREVEIKDKEIDKEKAEKKIKEIEDFYDEEIRKTKKGLVDISKIIKDDNTIDNAWEELLQTMSATGNTFYATEVQNIKGFIKTAKDLIAGAKLDTTNMEESLNNVNKSINDIEDKKIDALIEKIFTLNEEQQKIKIPKPAETNVPPPETPKPQPKNKGTEDKTSDVDLLKETGLFSNVELENTIKATMQNNSNKWKNTTDQKERQRLAEENTKLGTDLGWVRKADGVWYKPDGTVAFEKGGSVDYTGFAWLDGSKAKPEYVLSSEQTNSFMRLVDMLPKMNMNLMNKSEQGKQEVYNISIDKIVTNDATEFINNLRKLTYNKGRGA